MGWVFVVPICGVTTPGRVSPRLSFLFCPCEPDGCVKVAFGDESVVTPGVPGFRLLLPPCKPVLFLDPCSAGGVLLGVLSSVLVCGTVCLRLDNTLAPSIESEPTPKADTSAREGSATSGDRSGESELA